MGYHLNYGYIWTHFGKLGWGLVLSLELAFVSILIGMAIGLSLALAYTGCGALVRRAVAGYVEFIRNVPLLLLVYLVFYGVPSVGGFAYDATDGEPFAAEAELSGAEEEDDEGQAGQDGH